MAEEENQNETETVINKEHLFAKMDSLVSEVFTAKARDKVNTLALYSQIERHKLTIENQKSQIEQLKEKLKKQENIEKKQEIQKESIKIVAKNINQSKDYIEIKKTIADLIIEIDECVALLDEQ